MGEREARGLVNADRYKRQQNSQRSEGNLISPVTKDEPGFLVSFGMVATAMAIGLGAAIVVQWSTP
jgi:hypothetical protein